MVLNGVSSGWEEVRSGIPQGSVIELALFLIMGRWHRLWYPHMAESSTRQLLIKT